MNAATAPERAIAPGVSRMVTADGPFAPEKWTEQQSIKMCRNLEAGHIVFLPKTPIEISAEDRELLIGHKQQRSAYHKNIAYRPLEDRVTGLGRSGAQKAQKLLRILREYSQRSVEFLKTFLSPYAGKWKLEFASFRPAEENGRPARLHARNDLLHLDSFPTRPTNGARILRFFTNINPTQNRVWLTSQTFEAFGPLMVKTGALGSSVNNPFLQGINSLARALHLGAANRSPYDDLMHRCHNLMKEDANFQETTPRIRREFPPNSSWMLFTDCVSHAVVSGQYALEQTLLVPHGALLDPQRSPLAILESLAGGRLTV